MLTEEALQPAIQNFAQELPEKRVRVDRLAANEEYTYIRRKHEHGRQCDEREVRAPWIVGVILSVS